MLSLIFYGVAVLCSHPNNLKNGQLTRRAHSILNRNLAEE